MRVVVFGIRGVGVSGGAEKHAEELYSRIDALILGRSPYKARNALNVKYLPTLKIPGVEVLLHSFLCTLYCLFTRPDVVHVHNIGSGLYIPILRAFKLKVVFTIHSLNYRHDKWNKWAKALLRLGERWGVKYANQTIVVARHLEKLLASKYGKGLVHIPNGISKDWLKSGNLEPFRKHGVYKNNYILYVGRISEEKGLIHLILAFKSLRNPKYSLVIAGEGTYNSEYDKLVRAQLYGNRKLIHVGNVTQEELRGLYQNCKLLAIPSLHEGFPLVLLEGLIQEVPCVLTDIPAHREIILPMYRYCRPQDPADLADRIRKVLKREASNLEREGYKWLVQKSYSWDNIAELTYEVYLQANPNREIQ